MIELKYNIQEDGILFVIEKDGSCVPAGFWEANELLSARTEVLQELVDNGNAVFTDAGCLVEFNALYLLTSAERRVLNMPEMFQHRIFIAADSLLNDCNFRYKVSFRSKSGDRFRVTRRGPLVLYSNKCQLLSQEQFLLLNAIDEFNGRDPSQKGMRHNMIELERIKLLAEKAGARIDSYLANEHVHVPSKIKMEIEKSGDNIYTVVPSIEHPMAHQFDRYMRQYTDAPDAIAMSDDNNERTRIVFNNEQKSVIQMVKDEYSSVGQEKLAKLVEHPEMILDPGICDLSEFYSDRVIDIGLYHPKFTSFISPFKSSWIPSFQIEDRVSGTSTISFETEEELGQFQSAIHEAEMNGSMSVSYHDTCLNIDDAKEIYRQAKQKLDHHNQEAKKEKEVLIIEENDENLGYSVGTTSNSGNGKYIFHSIRGLNPDFSLKAHQMEGVAWMQYLIEKGQKGCLLADDMGLGKTLQILSLIDWYDKDVATEDKPYLIVAPVSLLENWKEEYERFFLSPRLPLRLLHGPALSGYYDKRIDQNLIHRMQKRQIILTNYETLRSFQFSFCAVNFALIILDEAQKIKTPGTMVTNASKALKGDFKIAMTGTPVENTLVDLWCIMDFALPGLLGNCREFSRKYQHAQLDDDVLSIGNEIRGNMGWYFLRRLKSEVLEGLPQKNIYRKEHEMPEVQYQMYMDIIRNAILEKESPRPTPGYMLLCLQKMKEISDHPYLCSENVLDYSVDELIESSAKMKAIMPILDDIKKKGEKVIIFAERRETQKILKRVLHSKYHIDSHIINGETPSTQSRHVSSGRLCRQQAIKHFQSQPGFNVIIMSPVAAGMGLNVVGANNVIHYSRHWNPAKEDQATDRVYRIGQKRDVNVYYPMAVSSGMNTFDQTLDALLKKKSELASATLFPTERIEVNSEELFNSLVY